MRDVEQRSEGEFETSQRREDGGTKAWKHTGLAHIGQDRDRSSGV